MTDEPCVRPAHLLRQLEPRELAWLLGAMAVSTTMVVAFILLTRPHALGPDELEYHTQGSFFRDGHFWWSTTPFGVPHPSMWKPPLYPAWVGVWYALIGPHPGALSLLQAPLAAVTVGLTWLLGRRLFDSRTALVAAWGVALFPLAWEFYGVLMSEALAVPLTVGVIYAFLGRDPTPKLALVVGGLIGLSLLLRPTALFLLVGAGASFLVFCGIRRGVGLTALAGLAAIVVVAPWTIRNYVVTDDLVPLSVQDSAIYGTFNKEAARDPDQPYAWRPAPEPARKLLAASEGADDGDLRAKLQDLAFDFIREHPESVPKAIYYNGLTRFWDLRAPGDALFEADTDGRSRAVRAIGLAAHWLILPLALFGLWRLRGRRELAVPVLAMLVGATLIFSVVAASRYRAPLEPLLIVLAAFAIGELRNRKDREAVPATGAPPA